MPESSKLSLATKDWIWLIVVIAGATVGNMGAMHAIESGVNERLILLDEKWQNRVEKIYGNMLTEIRRVDDQHPPEWLLKMVGQNTQRIERLEDQ